MKQPQLINRLSLRRQFDRRAESIANADFLLREIERRAFERLDYIKLQPQVILDVGCGQGKGTMKLAQRFVQAQVIGMDQSPAMIAGCQRRYQAPTATTNGLKSLANTVKRWLPSAKQASPQPVGQSIQWMCADSHQIPLPDASVDLIWSNCAMHWFADPREVIAQWRRILRPNGLLMFTSFGVQTLQELSALGAVLPTFQDMHDIGDQMQNQKFAEPVMDMETLHFTYQHAADVLRDVRAIGGNAIGTNAAVTSLNSASLGGDSSVGPTFAANHAKGLRGRALKQQILANLVSVDCLTFEIVYGHAWAPAQKRLPEGYSPIEFRPRGG